MSFIRQLAEVPRARLPGGRLTAVPAGSASAHIEQVGDALVGDPAFLHRHGATLQALDLINQNLRHLAAVGASADKEAAAERISLEELRRRLTPKGIRAIGGVERLLRGAAGRPAGARSRAGRHCIVRTISRAGGPWIF